MRRGGQAHAESGEDLAFGGFLRVRERWRRRIGFGMCVLGISICLWPRVVPPTVRLYHTLYPPGRYPVPCTPRAYGFTVALELLKERYLLLCTTLGSNLLKCYSSRCALNLLNWRYRVVLVYSE